MINYNQLYNVLSFIYTITYNTLDIDSMSPNYIESVWQKIVGSPFEDFNYVDPYKIDDKYQQSLRISNRSIIQNVDDYCFMWVVSEDQNHIIGILFLLYISLLFTRNLNRTITISDVLNIYDDFIGSYDIKKEKYENSVFIDNKVEEFCNKDYNQVYLNMIMRNQQIDDVLS